MPPYECDECGVFPIRGTAWQCESCADYRLCGTCEHQKIHGFPHHNFTALEGIPVDANRPYPLGSRDCIMDDPDSSSLRRLRNDYTSYQKLNVEEKEIRLLAIEPNVPGTVLTCVTTKVSEPWNQYNYTAVSYCWGDYRNVRTIRMAHVMRGPEGVRDFSDFQNEDFREYQVTRSLYRVLERLRCNPKVCEEESWKGQWFWIDALSINQGNLEERSHQVTLMGDIYSNARRIEVFLNSCALKEYLPIFICGLSALLELDEDVDLLGNIPEVCMIAGGVSPINYRTGITISEKELLEELAKIFDSPWFHRVWVLQEVLRAKRDAVVCRLSHREEVRFRDILLAFNYFRLAIVISEHRSSYLVPELWAGMLSLQRASLVAGTGYMSIIQLFRNIVVEFKATVPRDMLFAVVDLSNDASTSSDQLLTVVPDYHSSTSTVFAQFTKAHIRYHRSLDILSVLNEVESTCRSCIPKSESQHHPTWALWPHTREKWKRGNLLFHSPCQTRKIGDVDVPLLDNCSETFTLPLRGRALATIALVLSPPIHFINTLDEQIPGWMGWWVRGKFSFENSMSVEAAAENWKFIKAAYHRQDEKQAAAQFWVLVRSAYQKQQQTHAPGHLIIDEELFEMFLETLLCISPSPTPGEPRIWQRPDIAECLAAYWVQVTTDPDMSLIPPRIRDHLMNCLPAENMRERAQDFATLAHESSGRRFFITATGNLGLCPLDTRASDLVVLLLGGRVPYILRKEYGGRSRGGEMSVKWTFVGECYIHGMMDGVNGNEVLDQGATTDVFYLR